MAPEDAVSDKGDEVYNLFRQRGIEHVLLCGVHTNMCILNRKFAIKQLVKWGCDVALCRDLTDTMYNPKKAPFVPHARGTDLVVQYIEKYWCPTVLSSDVLGDAPPPQVVIVTAEQEYDAKDTLPAFAKAELEDRLGCKVTCINSDSTTDVPGLEALDDADLLVMFMRRRTLPEAQLSSSRRISTPASRWWPCGRAATPSRTGWRSTAKSRLPLQQPLPQRRARDRQDAGTPAGGEAALTHVKVVEKSAADPILRGVAHAFDSAGSLYKVSPLAEHGHAAAARQDGPTSRPSRWRGRTRTTAGGSSSRRSGHPEDFEKPAFRTLLRNAVLWALDQPVEAEH